MSMLNVVRAFRMALGQLATELALAIIVMSILIGGIASNIFFATTTVYYNVSGITNNTVHWDPISLVIWPYIFPLVLAAILVAILYHMYTGTKD